MTYPVPHQVASQTTADSSVQTWDLPCMKLLIYKAFSV
jgi:hypothetical protein